jgi:hypothetical protein
MASYHDLRDFPFDDQTFRISLVPFEWTDKDIELAVDQTVTGRRELLNISDWEIDGVRAVTRACEERPCALLRFPYNSPPNNGLLPLEGYPATVSDRRDVLVRILDQPGTLWPTDRPLGDIHADVDRIHLRHDQYGA